MRPPAPTTTRDERAARARRHGWAWGWALGALSVALGVNYLSGSTVDRIGATAPRARDLLLSVLPVVDTSTLYVWGFAAFVVFALAAGARYERRRLPWLTWCFAVLVITRSAFLVLTPLRAPEGQMVVDSLLYDWVGRYLTFENDLFFSAHTGIPFLGFLAFRTRWVRGVCLGFSVVLAATVLLGRMHYTVDVAGAYFITFATYRLTRLWSPRFLRGRV